MTDLQALYEALDKWTDYHDYSEDFSPMLTLLAIVENALVIKEGDKDGS